MRKLEIEVLGRRVVAPRGRRAGDDRGIGTHDDASRSLAEVVGRRRLGVVLLDLSGRAHVAPVGPADHELVGEVGDAAVDRRVRGVAELRQQERGAGVTAVGLRVLEDQPLADRLAQPDRVGDGGKARRGAQAVVVEAHPDVGIALLAEAGLRSDVELEVRLVERQVLRSTVRTAAMTRSKNAVSSVWSKPPGGQPAGFMQDGVLRARPRLVEQVVAEDARLVAEALGHPHPHAPDVVLQADPVRRGRVRPEVVVGAVGGAVGEVVAGEPELRLVRKPVVAQEPVGEPAASVAGGQQVLVQVEQREDPAGGEEAVGPHEALEVLLVDPAGLRRERLRRTRRAARR